MSGARIAAALAALSAWALSTETGLAHHRALASPTELARALVTGVADGTLGADLFSKRKSDSTLNLYIVADVSAAVPAARRSRNSDFSIASRKRSRSSVMCISHGLFRFAALGSMRRFSGGLERIPPSTTLDLDLHLGADYP